MATPPSYAQEQHDDQGKPESAPPKTPNDKAKPDKEKPAKPAKEQPKAEQPKTEKQSQQAEKQNEKQQKDQENAQKAQEKTQKEQQKQVKSSNQEQQASTRSSKTGREGVEQSKGGGHGRIPDDRFKAHFGREHHFHIGHPEVVEGRPRFSYGGYSFIIVQAWPADWGYDDDVYVSR